MFFWNIIIRIGVIDESSHHFSFDTHLNQDSHRASRWLGMRVRGILGF